MNSKSDPADSEDAEIIQVGFAGGESLGDDHSSFYLSRHPLSGFSLEDRRTLVRDIARNAQQDFVPTLEAITDYFKKYHAGTTLAALASKHLMRPFSADGKVIEYDKETVVLAQSKIELAQAFALAQSPAGTTPPTSKSLHALTNALDRITDLFQRRDLASSIDGSDNERRLRLLQAQLRGHTAVVRNWGYFDHVNDILERLLAPLDAQLAASTGLTASQLLDLFRTLTEIVQMRTRLMLSEPKQWFAEQTMEQIYAAFAKRFGYSKEQQEKEWAEIKEHQFTREVLEAFIQDRFLSEMPSAYAFSIPATAAFLQVDEANLRRSIDALSLPLEGLAESNVEKFFLANPIWPKPLILLDNNHFFAFLPTAFFSHSFQIFNDLMDGDPKRLAAYSSRRAKFLEEEIAALFANAFKGASIDTNVHWSTSDEEGETDVIVRVDSQLFLIEAKAGRISASALRGGMKRVEKHVDELLLEPARQSARMKKHLLTQPEERSSDWTIKTDLNLSGITRVTRLSVTLEDFATIQCNMPLLAEQMQLIELPELPAVLTLADLRTVFEILDEPWQRLHYLVQRGELQNHVRYVGDELDLLGMYLRNGFAMMGLADTSVPISISGMSTDVDAYFTTRDVGLNAPKPHRRFTPWFRAIIERLSNVSLSGKSEMLITIGAFSLDAQIDLQNAVNDLLAKMRADPKHENDCVYGVPRGWLLEGVAIHVSRCRDREKEIERESNAASHLFSKTNAKRCLVITLQLDGSDFPYTRCGLALHPDLE